MTTILEGTIRVPAAALHGETVVPGYFSRSGLIRRGWTDALIRDLLGDPDETVENPHYARGTDMHLFRMGRVAEAEAGERFAARLAAVDGRRSQFGGQ